LAVLLLDYTAVSILDDGPEGEGYTIELHTSFIGRGRLGLQRHNLTLFQPFSLRQKLGGSVDVVVVVVVSAVLTCGGGKLVVMRRCGRGEVVVAFITAVAILVVDRSKRLTQIPLVVEGIISPLAGTIFFP
jgi:hypothetical protein